MAKAKPAPKKKEKEIPFTYFGVNIKIRSSNPNKEEVYSDLSPDNTGSINSNTNFVKGFLELATENGTAIATIVNEQGKQEKIETVEYPRKETIKVKEGNEKSVMRVLFDKMMHFYRGDGNPVENGN